MARFEDSIAYVLSNEGLYSNHPRDPGGPTMWGISLRFLQAEGVDIDGDGDVDIEDIRALTRTDAIILYAQKFWKPLGLDRVDSQAVATRVFDMAVNMGVVRAVKIAQCAYNALVHGEDDRLLEDGKLGPKTRRALNSVDPVKMMGSLRQHHEKFYVQLVKSHPDLEVFLEGWRNRARK